MGLTGGRGAVADTREERVAELAETLYWAQMFGGRSADPKSYPSQTCAALLTTVEALAGLGNRLKNCPECDWMTRHHQSECTVGIASEAWRRFTQKGEHG